MFKHEHRDPDQRGQLSHPSREYPRAEGEAEQSRPGLETPLLPHEGHPLPVWRVDHDVKVSDLQIENVNQTPDRREARTGAGISTGRGSAGGNRLRWERSRTGSQSQVAVDPRTADHENQERELGELPLPLLWGTASAPRHQTPRRGLRS